MEPGAVMMLAKDTLYVTALIAAPVLLTALGLGLIIGLFQAATQIQEQTLSFIPKLLGMGLAILLAGPWMLNLIVEFTRRLYEQIPVMLG